MSTVEQRTPVLTDLRHFIGSFLRKVLVTTVDFLLSIIPALVVIVIYYALMASLVAGAGNLLGLDWVFGSSEAGAAITTAVVHQNMMLYLLLGIISWSAGVAWVARPLGWTGTPKTVEEGKNLKEKLQLLSESLIRSHHITVTIIIAAFAARLVEMLGTGTGLSAIRVVAPLLVFAIPYLEIYAIAGSDSESGATLFESMGALSSTGWLVIFTPIVVLEHFVSQILDVGSDPLAELLREFGSATLTALTDHRSGMSAGAEISGVIDRRLSRGSK
jgi:hypothetical protein